MWYPPFVDGLLVNHWLVRASTFLGSKLNCVVLPPPAHMNYLKRLAHSQSCRKAKIEETTLNDLYCWEKSRVSWRYFKAISRNVSNPHPFRPWSSDVTGQAESMKELWCLCSMGWLSLSSIVRGPGALVQAVLFVRKMVENDRINSFSLDIGYEP